MTLPSCTAQSIRKAFPEPTGDCWFRIPNPVTTDGQLFVSRVIRLAPAICAWRMFLSIGERKSKVFRYTGEITFL